MQIKCLRLHVRSSAWRQPPLLGTKPRPLAHVRTGAALCAGPASPHPLSGQDFTPSELPGAGTNQGHLLVSPDTHFPQCRETKPLHNPGGWHCQTERSSKAPGLPVEAGAEGGRRQPAQAGGSSAHRPQVQETLREQVGFSFRLIRNGHSPGQKPLLPGPKDSNPLGSCSKGDRALAREPDC